MFTDFFHFDDNCSIQSECCQVVFRAQVFTSYTFHFIYAFVGVVSIYSEYYQEFITGRVCNYHMVSISAIWIGDVAISSEYAYQVAINHKAILGASVH